MYAVLWNDTWTINVNTMTGQEFPLATDDDHKARHQEGALI